MTMSNYMQKTKIARDDLQNNSAPSPLETGRVRRRLAHGKCKVINAVIELSNLRPRTTCEDYT